MTHRFLDELELVGLSTDWSNLTDEQQTLINKLVENGQQHLFDGWDGPGRNDEAKARFLASLAKIDGNYPGGLVGYISNARTLLAEARAGGNPFEGFVPEQPNKVDLTKFDDTYDH